MSPHLCHARGCSVRIPPVMLMCRRHWCMVPLPLRLEVLRHYRPGQCDDKNVSAAWLSATQAAIAAVQEKENGGTPCRVTG